MSRKPSTFRQIDLTRALRASIAAGITIKQIEIEPNGKITTDTSAAPNPPENGNDLDKWMKAHARPA